MYKKILVTLDTSPTDRAIIEHIAKLAPLLHSPLVLLHVVDTPAAQWHGPDAGGGKVEESRAYLEKVARELAQAGAQVATDLAYGDPVTEIVKYIAEKGCDLVAMSTHGHGFVADMILGTTAIKVQHSTSVPVLMIRAR